MGTIRPLRISLPRKPRRVTIFRICSIFNATGLALEVSEHHPAQERARHPQHNLGKVKVAPDAVVGVAQGRRTGRRGMPNR
jgi:hypothetical protein